jgi:hypothetical protein
MREMGRSRPERSDGCLESLDAHVEQALSSLGEAEIHLRNIRMNRLPQVAESLSAAAADVESLRVALPAADLGVRNTAAIRARIKSLEHAATRVSALHEAANNYLAGLMLVRKQEVAEYDAVGAVCGTPGFHVPLHCLETRG